MITISRSTIEKAEKDFRVNLINSVTGAKPGNLIGTVDLQGNLNVAIFSSVVHLGSHPPLIGFFLRPSFQTKRDTYNNIIQTGDYTINSIPLKLIENAHDTSRKFPADVSEFDECSISYIHREGVKAPFVSDSPIQLSMKFLEEKTIRQNNTSLIIGEVDAVHIDSNIFNQNGDLDLERACVSAIGGLRHYYKLNKVQSF